MHTNCICSMDSVYVYGKCAWPHICVQCVGYCGMRVHGAGVVRVFMCAYIHVVCDACIVLCGGSGMHMYVARVCVCVCACSGI